MKTSAYLAGLLVLGLASCATLKKEPWANVHKGTNSLTASTGWATYEAGVHLEGKSGALTGLSGSETAKLKPRGGGGLRYSRFLTDNWSLGLLVEYRRFDPDPVAPLGATIDAKRYQTWHFILANRFWGPPFGADDRWRAFAGLDLGYIPKVDLDARVDYGAAAGPARFQDITVKGDSYTTIGGLVGLSYLLRDNLAISFGAFYEHPLDTSDDTVTLNVPTPFGIVPSDVDAQVSPDGVIGFVSLSWFF